jgi:alkylation response protein AidB-like acyl-CoA dehydrogenase/acyl-CoA synthetase (AMP-forming)/AMP-acid ligase II
MEGNLAVVQEALAERLADREAVVTADRRLTWAELTDRSRRLANMLLAAGVTVRTARSELAPYESGQDAVALYLFNGHQYLEAMLGAFKARAVPGNVNYRYVEAELLQLLGDMAPRAIVFDGRFASRLAAVVDRLPHRPILLQVAAGAAPAEPLLPGAVDYETALAGASPARPPVDWSPDDLYTLYTGGTTGQPKGVLWRQADVFVAAMGGRNFRERREWRSIDEIVDAAVARPGPRVLSAAPFMHGTGQWVAFQALHAGGSVVVPPVVDRYDAADVLDTVEVERVTLLVIAGEAFARPLLDAVGARRRDLTSLTTVASSGAALSPASVDELRHRLPGLRVRDTVGSSEAGPQAEILTADGSGLPPSFQPTPGTCVVDETMTHVLARGHAGVGWLARAGRVPLGYLGDAERTARTFPTVDGRRMAVPGDRARLLADGRIELLGRDATTINTGGEKVFAEEVEAAVRADPAVRDVVVVVGRPSERWGSEVVALVQPEPGATLDRERLRATCAERLARYKLPKAFVEVDAVRRSPSGKVDLAWARSVVTGSAVAVVPSGVVARPPAAAPAAVGATAGAAADRLPVGSDDPVDAVADAVRRWVVDRVPAAWVAAGQEGGAAAVRRVRSRAEYEAWYPVFAASGLAVPGWPTDYGGLDLAAATVRRIDAELAPYNLGRLNPLGLNLVAPALFAHGTEAQRRRYLPPLVRNEERWCQLFSEPGAGSDLASLSTRALRDGDDWVVDGQKVWTTWAHRSDLAVLLARTDPDVPKRRGLTYFVVDLRSPGVDVRPLRHMGGDVEFNEVFLTGVRVPDDQRVGEVGEGWAVANATLSGERQMVSGAGSGGVDRIGGRGVEHLVALARRPAANGCRRWDDPLVRQALMRLYAEERIRDWTNQRVRAQVRAGRSPGPESSIGKVHQGALNQRAQLLAVDLLGLDAVAWAPDDREAGNGEAGNGGVGNGGVGDGAAGSAGPGYGAGLPPEVRGMLRSRANTIEGGTTEVNKNVIGERVLGLPREPDPFRSTVWRDVPRS